jgi:hypothetical protein
VACEPADVQVACLDFDADPLRIVVADDPYFFGFAGTDAETPVVDGQKAFRGYGLGFVGGRGEIAGIGQGGVTRQRPLGRRPDVPDAP